jgi:RHS repeat-associated protein
VVAESDGTGQVTAQNIWGHKALAREISGTYYYYLYNGHGDVIQVIDENGNAVNSYSYDEWGNILSSQEQISNPMKYAGEYYDEETGLYYLRARYYDPSIGRFISKDSVEGEINNPLTINLYTYCANNPINSWDPSGNSIINDIIVFGK